KGLYMLSRPVKETLSATRALISSRRRLVYRISLLSWYEGVKADGISMPKSCCCRGAGKDPIACFRLLNVRLLRNCWYPAQFLFTVELISATELGARPRIGMENIVFTSRFCMVMPS